MNIKFAETLLILGLILSPVGSYATDTSTDTAGQYIDDTSITTKVKTSFAIDRWVKGRDISVRTYHGIVDLTGTVDSKTQSNRATELATEVESVRAVNNNLKIAER